MRRSATSRARSRRSTSPANVCSYAGSPFAASRLPQSASIRRSGKHSPADDESDRRHEHVGIVRRVVDVEEVLVTQITLHAEMAVDHELDPGGGAKTGRDAALHVVVGAEEHGQAT